MVLGTLPRQAPIERPKYINNHDKRWRRLNGVSACWGFCLVRSHVSHSTLVGARFLKKAERSVAAGAAGERGSGLFSKPAPML